MQVFELEHRFGERLILVPWRRRALLRRLVDRVVTGELGLGTEQLARDGERRRAESQLAQLRGIERGLEHRGQDLGLAGLGGVRLDEVQIASGIAAFAGGEHLHERLPAPGEFLGTDLRGLDDQEALALEIGHLFRREWAFLGWGDLQGRARSQ